jgi:hypothetical protein
MGTLWEHLVLDTLLFHLPAEEIHYWRDKQKHEIDFIWAPRNAPPVAIQCKWRAAAGDPAEFASFSSLYPAADRTGAIARSQKAKSYTEPGIDAIPELICKHRQRGS